MVLARRRRGTAEASDMECELREQMKREDGLLLGRATFEQFRSYWRKQAGDATGISEHLNKIHKYVVSSTIESPEWQNTTVLPGRWATRSRR